MFFVQKVLDVMHGERVVCDMNLCKISVGVYFIFFIRITYSLTSEKYMGII